MTTAAIIEALESALALSSAPTPILGPLRPSLDYHTAKERATDRFYQRAARFESELTGRPRRPGEI